MNRFSRYILVLFRVALGWLLLYAGTTKLLDSSWSSAGYLEHAQTLPQFFAFLATPEVLPFTNFINEWGLTLLGLFLILGLFVKIVGPLAAVLMILYYLPVLTFPLVGEHSYLVDEHIVYALGFLLLAGLNAGRYLGIDGKMQQW